MQNLKGKLNPALTKIAEIEKSVDIFQKTSNKRVRESEWDYHLPNPPVAEDYTHVCRIPIAEITKNKRIFSEGIDEMSFVYAMINRKHPTLQQMKEKYCVSTVKRMKEPDMVCVGGKRPECRFIENMDPEAIAETGSKFTWVHPTSYSKEKMLTKEWAWLLYPDVMRKKRQDDYLFVR